MCADQIHLFIRNEHHRRLVSSISSRSCVLQDNTSWFSALLPLFALFSTAVGLVVQFYILEYLRQRLILQATPIEQVLNSERSSCPNQHADLFQPSVFKGQLFEPHMIAQATPSSARRHWFAKKIALVRPLQPCRRIQIQNNPYPDSRIAYAPMNSLLCYLGLPTLAVYDRLVCVLV